MKLVYLTAIPAALAAPQDRNIIDGDLDPVYGDLVMLRDNFNANYGCYSYFTQEIPEGKFSGGVPVDAYDALAKVYRGQMTCADTEHAEAGQSSYTISYENPYDEETKIIYTYACQALGCDPAARTFEIPTDELIIEECDDLNNANPTNPELAKATCYAETRFLAEWLKMVHVDTADPLNGWWSPEYKHENGFDPNTECLATVSLGSGINGGVIPAENTVCCGAHPNRGSLTEIQNIRVCSADGQSVCDLLADPSCV
jgi:hypothetical protein